MKTLTSLIASFALAIVLTGCGGGDHKDHKDHKDDAHGDEHKDHKDDAHGGHQHGGPSHALGSVDIGGFKVVVEQMGEAKAGGEGDFHLKVSGSGKVTALRAWVGAQDGKGSNKVTAKMEGEGSFDASMDIPDPIPAGGKLWIELEVEGGTKPVGSINFKP